jgi:RNA polymerase sigma factor (sigma-70 family)
MTVGPGNMLCRHLRKAVGLPDPNELTDGQLLAQFLENDARSDREVSFEHLVRRHGPMVLGVCRRILGNANDADDAFQAVFVVLVRRGWELTGRASIGDWLHGVANRTALRARATAMKRRTKENAAARPLEAPPAVALTDWQPILDQELSQLPEKYRQALVLCELEGLSRKEVAGRLGIVEGTLSSRLSTAKKTLANRLRKRGVTIASGMLTAMLAPLSPAAISSSLLASTTRAAVVAAGHTPGALPAPINQLATEVTRIMFFNKLRIGLIFLPAVLLLATGAGVAIPQSTVPRVAAPRKANPTFEDTIVSAKSTARVEEKPVPATLKELREKEEATRKNLSGTWVVQRMLVDDEVRENRKVSNETFEFGDRTVKSHQELDDGREVNNEFNFTVNPTTSPAELTIYGKDFLLLGIYDLNGENLKIAVFGVSEIERPKGFASKVKRVTDMPLLVWELKRKK